MQRRDEAPDVVRIEALERPLARETREQQAVAADAGRHLTALLDEWRAKYPDVPVGQEVVHGHPGRALVGLSARADLVVVGRHAKHPGLPGAGFPSSVR